MIPESPQSDKMPEWLQEDPAQKEQRTQVIDRKVLQAEINAASHGQETARKEAFQAYLKSDAFLNANQDLSTDDVHAAIAVMDNPKAPIHVKRMVADTARWLQSDEGKAFLRHKNGVSRVTAKPQDQNPKN